MESRLPQFLQLSTKNPLFSSNAAQDAQQQYYQDAIMPQLNGQAIQEFLGGNGDSTFGGSMLGSEAAQGADQAFFSGQQYYDNELNNTLNERNNFFGNDVGTAQTQDNLQSQLQGQTNQLNASDLNSLNQFNLGGAQVENSMGSNLLNAQTSFDASKMAARSSLISGLFGLGGGLGNMLFGGSSGGGGGGGGLENLISYGNSQGLSGGSPSGYTF